MTRNTAQKTDDAQHTDTSTSTLTVTAADINAEHIANTIRSEALDIIEMNPDDENLVLWTQVIRHSDTIGERLAQEWADTATSTPDRDGFSNVVGRVLPGVIELILIRRITSDDFNKLERILCDALDVIVTEQSE